MTARAVRRRRTRDSGQGLVEFSLVGPIALVLIFGIIVASFLFFQRSDLRDGATAGARMAAVETSLATQVGSQYCESNSPQPIETVVGTAVPGIQINTARLCASSSTATQLTQSPSSSTGVNVTVTASPNISSPSTLTVTLNYTAKGFGPPPFNGSYVMSSASTVPTKVP